jgi:hypothetical protein
MDHLNVGSAERTKLRKMALGAGIRLSNMLAVPGRPGS